MKNETQHIWNSITNTSRIRISICTFVTFQLCFIGN